MKYTDQQIKKAMRMKLERKGDYYLTTPTTDKDTYKHKIKLDKDKNPICGCTWSQINLKKENKKYCSHALAVLHKVNKNKFIVEVSKKQ